MLVACKQLGRIWQGRWPSRGTEKAEVASPPGGTRVIPGLLWPHESQQENHGLPLCPSLFCLQGGQGPSALGNKRKLIKETGRRVKHSFPPGFHGAVGRESSWFCLEETQLSSSQVEAADGLACHSGQAAPVSVATAPPPPKLAPCVAALSAPP